MVSRLVRIAEPCCRKRESLLTRAFKLTRLSKTDHVLATYRDVVRRFRQSDDSTITAMQYIEGSLQTLAAEGFLPDGAHSHLTGFAAADLGYPSDTLLVPNSSM